MTIRVQYRDPDLTAVIDIQIDQYACHRFERRFVDSDESVDPPIETPLDFTGHTATLNVCDPETDELLYRLTVGDGITFPGDGVTVWEFSSARTAQFTKEVDSQSLNEFSLTGFPGYEYEFFTVDPTGCPILRATGHILSNVTKGVA